MKIAITLVAIVIAIFIWHYNKTIKELKDNQRRADQRLFGLEQAHNRLANDFMKLTKLIAGKGKSNDQILRH